MQESNMSGVATEESAPSQVAESTTKAWASHDPDAFAAAFTADSNVVIAGAYLQNHAEVLAYISAAFSGPVKGTRVISDPVYLEYLGDNIALMITEGGILVPGETEVSPERAIRGTWVLAKVGKEWLIRAYHSSPIPPKA